MDIRNVHTWKTTNLRVKLANQLSLVINEKTNTKGKGLIYGIWNIARTTSHKAWHTTTDYRSWEYKPGTWEVSGKKVRWQEHPWYASKDTNLRNKMTHSMTEQRTTKVTAFDWLGVTIPISSITNMFVDITKSDIQSMISHMKLINFDSRNAFELAARKRSCVFQVIIQLNLMFYFRVYSLAIQIHPSIVVMLMAW